MNIKSRLKALLREAEIKQEDLYFRTGYEFSDVKTKEDFNEIVRLFSNTICGLKKYYIEEE